MLPYVAREIYQIDQTGLGYLIASLASGALVGALAMTWSGIGIQLPRIMIVSAVIWHGLLLVFAQMHSMSGGVVFLILSASMQSFDHGLPYGDPAAASSQRFRGRVMGVRMMAIYSLPLGL